MAGATSYSSKSHTNSSSTKLDPKNNISIGLNSYNSISRGSNSSSSIDPHNRFRLREYCQLQRRVLSCPRLHLGNRGRDSSAREVSSGMAIRASRDRGCGAVAGQRADATPTVQSQWDRTE